MNTDKLVIIVNTLQIDNTLQWKCKSICSNIMLFESIGLLLATNNSYQLYWFFYMQGFLRIETIIHARHLIFVKRYFDAQFEYIEVAPLKDSWMRKSICHVPYFSLLVCVNWKRDNWIRINSFSSQTRLLNLILFCLLPVGFRFWWRVCPCSRSIITNRRISGLDQERWVSEC